jgi:hypothetical protein
MNLYVIVEGRRTEKKVYPAWFKYLIPKLERVNLAKEANTNNYYLFNGNGFPALLHNHLRNSIQEVNEHTQYKYLVLVLDVDESTVNKRKKEVENFISNENLKLENLKLENAKLVIIPQDKCIETWFLGNQKIYKNNPENKTLIDYINFYNVKELDPELMGIIEGFNTHAQFHSDYCTIFLRERNIRYSKNKPNGVTEKDYLDQLILRGNKTGHLSSFINFIEFCNKIRIEIEQ